MGTLRRTCATAPRRGPLPKLLWANLLLLLLLYPGSKDLKWMGVLRSHGLSYQTIFVFLKIYFKPYFLEIHLLFKVVFC